MHSYRGKMQNTVYRIYVDEHHVVNVISEDDEEPTNQMYIGTIDSDLENCEDVAELIQIGINHSLQMLTNKANQLSAKPDRKLN